MEGPGAPQTPSPSPCSTAALGLALQAHAEAMSHPPSESPPSPLSPLSPLSPNSASSSLEEELSPGSPESRGTGYSATQGEETIPPGQGDMAEPYGPLCLSQDGCSYNRRASRKLVLRLAANVRGGVALRRYSPLAGTSPVAPTGCPSHPLTLQKTASPSGTAVHGVGGPLLVTPTEEVTGAMGPPGGLPSSDEDEERDGDESLLIC